MDGHLASHVHEDEARKVKEEEGKRKEKKIVSARKIFPELNRKQPSHH